MCLPLPVAFRRLLRPSSVSSAKASTVRPYLLNHYFRVFAFGLLEFCLFNFTLDEYLLTTTYVIDLLLCLLMLFSFQRSTSGRFDLPKPNRKQLVSYFLLRKEVIHPHVPVGIPCYDLTPVIGPTFDGSLLAVMPPASGITNSHGLTGGVYKTRERIHRSMLICDY